MKTKEQILNDHGRRISGPALSAMDEFAKQQAISFAKYMFEEVWQMNGMNPSPYTSDEEFYNKFIEKQNK